MMVQTPANYKVGDRISLSTDPANTFYDVTAVNGDAITISQVPGGGGLVNPITTATATTVNHSYQAGTNVVNGGSTTGVTAARRALCQTGHNYPTSATLGRPGADQ